MLAPAADLTIEIITRLAVAAEPLCDDIDTVQGGDHAVHFGVDGGAFFLKHPRQGLVPQDAALDEVHDVKGPPNDRFVFTQAVHGGHRHLGAGQSAHDGELAFDGMGRWQELGNRPGLGTHDINAAGSLQFIGGIALPAFEGCDGQRAFKTGQMPLQPEGQGGSIKAVLVRNRLGADEVVKVSHAWISLVGRAEVQLNSQIGFRDTHQRLPVADD